MTANNPAEASIDADCTTTITEAELASAFTEWDRRYREEPLRFQSEVEHLLSETPETYGQACAPYLLAIIDEGRASDGNR